MDPLTTLPEEGVNPSIEEVRDLVRKRDASPGEEPPTKRPRADTRDLIMLEDMIEDDTPPPKPEASLEMYDRRRLQTGLRHISAATKRNITPRTQVFLEMYKDAYKTALMADTRLTEARAVVQALDRVYISAAFLYKPRAHEEHHLLMAYVKLRRLEFLANYGDYLGAELQEFRAKLKSAAKNEGGDVEDAMKALSGHQNPWLEIAEKLDEEIADYADVTSLRKHLWVACDVLGLERKHMLWLINEWAERNRLYHNHVRKYVEECKWAPLAEQISRDLAELVNVASDEDNVAQYERVISRMRDEYFEYQPGEEPGFWIPNEKARDLTYRKHDKERLKADRGKASNT